MDAKTHAPSADLPPHSSSLSARLKHETRALHRQAEQSGIMQRLLRGRATRPMYCALLRNLYEIYAPLENGLQRHHAHPQVQPIFAPGLMRVAHLANDLVALAGEGWPTEIAVQPAARAYRDALNLIGETRPHLLAAHAYVRYLGDLSGGQIVHRLVAKQLHLGETATRFYQFGAPADVDLLLAQFRAGLDAIPLTGNDADEIVGEALGAFRRHVDLFEELAQHAPR